MACPVCSTVLPCSIRPAAVPAAAATAAAATVTEAGVVVCLLPTVKSPIASQLQSREERKVRRSWMRNRGEMEKW